VPRRPNPLLQFAIEAGFKSELAAQALARFSRSVGVAQPGEQHAFEVSGCAACAALGVGVCMCLHVSAGCV